MPVEILRRYSDGTYKHLDKRTGQELFGYEIQITENGEAKKKRKSGFPTRELAQQARAAVRLKPLLAAHGLIESVRITFKQLLDAWLADARDRELAPAYIGHMEFVSEYFSAQFAPGFHLDQINAESIRKFKSRRLEDKTHAHSLRKDLAILGALFRSAKVHFPDLKWTPPPINKPQREYDSRDVVLTPAEINRLLAAIDGLPDQRKYRKGNQLARDFIIIALHTARRESEILMLAKDQIGFSPAPGAPFGHISFNLMKKNRGKSKAASRRFIPMTAAVAEIMRRRYDESRNGYLFIGTSFVQAVGALTRAFRRVCKEAKIAHGYASGGAVIHTLRHSAATYLSSQGLPLEDLQAILGHESITMSLKYMHTTPERIGKAIMALSSFGVQFVSSPEPEKPETSASLDPRESEKALKTASFAK